MDLNPQFLAWLEASQERIAAFIGFMQKWYEHNNLPTPISDAPPDGPHEWHAGETVTLNTKPLSWADIDAMNRGMAEAVVKEKAIEFIKGFVSGVMLAA